MSVAWERSTGESLETPEAHWDTPRWEEPAGVLVVVSAAEAFAWSMVAVTALALAFASGRHFPYQVPQSTEARVESLEQLRQQPAIPLEQVPLDPGS